MKVVSEGEINEIVRLKSKGHSMKSIDDKESNAAKGVNIATKFTENKNILFNKKEVRHKMRKIPSKNHKTGTYEGKKISWSYFDDKRFVLDYGIHTLVYFHKDCKKKIDVLKESHRFF